MADKGYDPYSIRQIIMDKGGKAIVPIRHFTDFHARADRDFMERYGKIYAKRNIAKSVFSAMKRRFGGELW